LLRAACTLSVFRGYSVPQRLLRAACTLSVFRGYPVPRRMLRTALLVRVRQPSWMQCLAWNPACRRFGMWQSCFPDMEPYFLTLACRRFGTWRAGVTAIIQKLACSGRHVVGC